MKLTAAIAQTAPVVLDLETSVERACEWIARAGERGARLLAFPETWLPGYPFWCDSGTFGRWEHGPSKRLHRRLMDNSLRVPSPELGRLAAAAREAGVAVVMGANERVGHTLYNALLFLDREGNLAAHRRKLVPTFGERLVWGHGDAADLEARDLGGFTVGGLICWEHWMPLPRHVLHAGGADGPEQVHVAAWPHGAERHQVASRHYAFEGRCYVLAAATYMERSDLPDDFELAGDLEGTGLDAEVILSGGSSVIAPDGTYLVEPVVGREELVVAELDLDRGAEEALTLDVAGHYSRPDLFDLRVRRDRLRPFREADERDP